MPVLVRSYAKINLGLKIGVRREDGFHELRTIYQTVALYDTLRVDFGRGSGIEIRCKDPRVPCDETNTCYRVADRVLRALKGRGKAVITIDKHLPVEGGLGGASGNAVATLLALEKAVGQALPAAERLRIAAEVGSDLPLFLYGGLVLGTGRGEEIWPLPDLPAMPIVIVTPRIGVSTAKAFADWDTLAAREAAPSRGAKLTGNGSSGTINQFSGSVYEWLTGTLTRQTRESATGVPAVSGDRAETLLLDLVRTGISNDFERVVFPEIPELREAKRALERAGAGYASLSGSGSSLYGLFRDAERASRTAEELTGKGIPAQATTLLPREQYWREMWEQ